MTKGSKERTYLLLILTTIIWGIQPLCIKWLIAEWSPVTITAMRYYIIGIVLIGIAWRAGEEIVPPRSCWLGLVGMGVMGIGFNNVMQFTGLGLSSVTHCTLIAAASPAITALFASILIRERLNLKAWTGIVISFLGALMVVSRGSWQVVEDFDFNLGDILFFTAQIAWTTYSIIALAMLRRMSAALTTGWAGLMGAIMVTIYGSLTGELSIVLLELPLAVAFLYTVVFGGIMAMLFWNIGVKNAGPSVTSIFQNITPVTGMIGGALLFNEVIGLTEISGAAAIFIGVYLTTHSQKYE